MNDDTITIETNPARRVATLREAVGMLDGRQIIEWADETKLTGVVMTLTGGSANPSVVRHHIQRIKTEARVARSDERKVPKMGAESPTNRTTMPYSSPQPTVAKADEKG